MDECSLLTNARPWRIARKVNQTSNGYVSKIPTTTEPVGDAGTATGAAVIDLTAPDTLGGLTSANRAMVHFFGAGSDTNTFSCRVIGWSCVAQAPGGLALGGRPVLWVPTVLVEVQATLSVQVGIAGSSALNTDRFADTIALTGTTANAGQGVEIVSPANDTIAHLVVDLKGAQKLEFSFTTGGSATDCNALYKVY